ncbi:hypothetical protein AYX15_07137 [Cryptococcus neoformans]|nr:hypothetical protein AYX15_07137 [Cryptococcus neoformans var. grubii]
MPTQPSNTFSRSEQPFSRNLFISLEAQLEVQLDLLI